MDSAVMELNKYTAHTHHKNVETLTIGDVGSLEADHFDVGEDFLSAVEHLEKLGHSGMPVIEDHRVVGFLSEKDCLKELYAEKFHQAYPGKVENYMMKNVMTLPINTPLYHVIDMFITNQFHVYPVVDLDGKFYGNIHRKEVLTFLLGK